MSREEATEPKTAVEKEEEGGEEEEELEERGEDRGCSVQ